MEDVSHPNQISVYASFLLCQVYQQGRKDIFLQGGLSSNELCYNGCRYNDTVLVPSFPTLHHLREFKFHPN